MEENIIDEMRAGKKMSNYKENTIYFDTYIVGELCRQGHSRMSSASNNEVTIMERCRVIDEFTEWTHRKILYNRKLKKYGIKAGKSNHLIIDDKNKDIFKELQVIVMSKKRKPATTNC